MQSIGKRKAKAIGPEIIGVPRAGAIVSAPKRVQLSSNMTPAAPDIILLAVAWKPRALLRAQLIEEGFAVVATDDWGTTRRLLRPGAKPKLVIVDLEELPHTHQVLNDLRILMKPARVLVLTALGEPAPEDLERLGFRAVRRPIAIKEVVAAVGDAISEDRAG